MTISIKWSCLQGNTVVARLLASVYLRLLNCTKSHPVIVFQGDKKQNTILFPVKQGQT